MATAAVPASSGLLQPRVLSFNKGSTKHRKNDIKAMIASLQNAPPSKDHHAPDAPANGHAPSRSSTESSKESPGMKMLQEHVKDETLLKVTIQSSVEPGKFYVPVSLLVDRELEMRKSAKDFGIRSTRWSKSRLFREWRTQLEEDVKNNETTPRTEMIISLDPEQDCASSNQSHSFQWQPWLTTCIRAYYNTGTIRIPDDCLGSDILLALEYFGILYSPDQLVFDSFGGYLRVKMWSDYFTHRAKMADWVVQKLVTTPSRHSHCFVTSPDEKEELFFLNSNKAMDVLDGDLALDSARYGTTLSRSVVHEFFNDEQEGKEYPENESPENEKMDGLMRQDFCAFVQASLPGTNVSFAIKQVTNSNKETVARAVLRINLVPKPVAEQPNASNPMEQQVQKVTPSVSNTSTSPETELTLPMTVSTQSELSTIEKAHALFRSKTEPSVMMPAVLDRSFEDRPHDEYTPTSSPDKKSRSSNQRSIWRKDESSIDQPRGAARYDEPSIDQPRETLKESTDFVRCLSERVIRQTIADMDTIDHGLPVQQHSPRPFDEGGEPHLTEDDIRHCTLPSLPSLELDKDYNRPTELPFQAHQEKYKTSLPIRHLDVIGTPTTFKTMSPVTAAEKPAPISHVDVDYVNKPSDGSVMSALSSPFDDHTHQMNPFDFRDSHRPQANVESLSGFRTPVDALSLADDRSVRIEGQEEMEENVPQPKTKRPRKKEYDTVDPDEESQAGCVSNFLNVVCAPIVGEDAVQNKRRSKHPRRSKYSDDDTPNTQSETDEDEDSGGDKRRKAPRRRNKSGRMSSEELIAEIGVMADTVVEGIAQSFGSMFDADGRNKSKGRSGQQQRPRRRNS